MQEASLISFIRTILIIMLFWYGFKILARIFFPMLLNKTMHKMEKRFKEQQEAQNPTPTQEDIGKTTIDSKPSNNTKKSESKGEYIDFEEVE